MTHAMKETVVAHMDGELPRAEALEVAEHVRSCERCAAQAARLREADGIFSAALRIIDADEPESWQTGSTPMDGAQERIIPLRPRVRTGRPWWSDVALLRRAAAILLFSAAAASAAVLGGRALLSDHAGSGTLTVPPAPAPPTIATVSVPPENGRVHITLVGAGNGTLVMAEVMDGTEATVSVEGTAPHVTVARSRVSVDLQGAVVVVRLGLPASLREAEIMADGTRVIQMRNGAVEPAAALSGGIVIGSRPLPDP